MTAQLTAVSEATGTLTQTSKSGVMRVRIIDEGTGSSGTYPATTLESAATDRVFHKGLHLHFDHPTVSETSERPERSVLTIAGALESDAKWNPDTRALEADFKPLPSTYDAIKERADLIGLSIRASAEVEDDGTIARIVEAQSVDLVTKAGRGGRILDVIESARREIAERNGLNYEPRHVDKQTGTHWDGQPITASQDLREAQYLRELTEATDNDVRRYLSMAVDAYDQDGQYAYLEDFDDTYVYFRLSRYTDEDRRVTAEFRQTYTRDGVNVTLSGEPEEVKPETTFTPTNPEPDTSTATAVESAPRATTGGSMEIKEAEYQRLSKAAERVQALETERDTAVQRADKAEASLAEAATRTEAQAIVAEAFKGIEAPKTQARLVESAVRADKFEAETFKTEAEDLAAEIAEAKGGPRITGFGDTAAPDTIQESDKVSDEDIVTALKGDR